MCTNTFIMKYQVKKSGSKFGVKVGFVAMELTFDEIVSNIDDLTGFFRACLPEDSIKDFEQSLGEVKPYLDLIPQGLTIIEGLDFETSMEFNPENGKLHIAECSQSAGNIDIKAMIALFWEFQQIADQEREKRNEARREQDAQDEQAEAEREAEYEAEQKASREERRAAMDKIRNKSEIKTDEEEASLEHERKRAKYWDEIFTAHSQSKEKSEVRANDIFAPKSKSSDLESKVTGYTDDDELIVHFKLNQKESIGGLIQSLSSEPMITKEIIEYLDSQVASRIVMRGDIIRMNYLGQDLDQKIRFVLSSSREE